MRRLDLPCAGSLRNLLQNKQGKSFVENLARSVEKEEKIRVGLSSAHFYATDILRSQHRGSKLGLNQPGGQIMPWGGEPAEAKRSKARSQGKACWHRGSGKQEEKRGSRGRIRDHRMRPAGIWAESKRTEPTGFQSSVTNLLPLPNTHLSPLSEAPTRPLRACYPARG